MNKYLIYMASGNSIRYGENKLLEKINGRPLYLRGLEVLKELSDTIDDCQVIVVSRYKEIQEKAESMGFQVVNCPESKYGISYTIKAGIKSIKNLRKDDYLIFVVADQPYMSLKSVVKLIETTNEKVTVARLFYGERPGNPVLFSATLVPELLSLEGDNGGGIIAKKYPCVPVYVEEPLELRDIDRKKDLWKN
ncbi:nucleotidyltransferase family protein [Faecalimonas sp.]